MFMFISSVRVMTRLATSVGIPAARQLDLETEGTHDGRPGILLEYKSQW
jgi:hypothetical protein